METKFKIGIIVLIIGIVFISGWLIWSFTHPKFCLTDLDCKYEKCESGCINRYSPSSFCDIKPAVWSGYIWNNMPCKCIDNKCVEDKKAFCQKACEDWKNSNCTDGIPKSAFIATKCEDKVDCKCLKQQEISITPAEKWIMGGTKTSSIGVKLSRNIVIPNENFVITVKSWTFSPTNKSYEFDAYFGVFVDNKTKPLMQEAVHGYKNKDEEYARVDPFNLTISAPNSKGKYTYEVCRGEKTITAYGDCYNYILGVRFTINVE